MPHRIALSPLYCNFLSVPSVTTPHYLNLSAILTQFVLIYKINAKNHSKFTSFSAFIVTFALKFKKQVMVIELQIKNFLSFKENTVISFEASKDTFKEDSLLITMPDGTRLSRIAIIYGANV